MNGCGCGCVCECVVRVCANGVGWWRAVEEVTVLCVHLLVWLAGAW